MVMKREASWVLSDELLGTEINPSDFIRHGTQTIQKQPKQARFPWIFFSASRVAWWCQEIPPPSALRRIVRGSAIARSPRRAISCSAESSIS